MLVASYGLVLVLNYLVGFVLLVAVYWKILKLIQRMKSALCESVKKSFLSESVKMVFTGLVEELFIGYGLV